MSGLTQGRDTVERVGNVLVLGVKANAEIFEGGMVALDGGYAVPATKKTTLVVAGRCENYVKNTGADGEAQVRVKRGVFHFENDETLPVDNTHLLKDCYVVDDNTVTSEKTGTCVAGKVLGFENGQVIVEIK